MNIVYTAETTVEGGRNGHVRSHDGKLDLELSPPGSSGTGTNPEQLFAAGFSACFFSALLYHGRHASVDLSDARIDAAVELVEAGGDYSLTTKLDVHASSVPEEQLAELVRKADGTCPYSKATRGNIDVELAVNGRPLEAAVER